MASRSTAPASEPFAPLLALDRGNASGRATRELLLGTAERLFAAKGVEAVSLREIALAAGQRNNNVVQYHFGDRSALVAAIYVFRSERLEQRRSELLGKLDEVGRGDDVAELVRIVFQPHAESLDDPDDHFLGLLSRVLVDLGTLMVRYPTEIAPSQEAHEALKTRIRQGCRQLSDARFAQRYDLLLNFGLTALAREKVARASGPGRDRDDLLDEIVAIVVAGLQLP